MLIQSQVHAEDAGIPFVKGHGTENDFVVLVDPQVRIDLTEQLVRELADRRAGIGGDGVIRIATAGALQRAGVLDALPDAVEPGDWFMDYRNADGSLAEMCGNGVRVFAHVLVTEGLLEATDGEFLRIGTRAGARSVKILNASGLEAQVSVDMGAPEVLGLSTARLGDFAVAGLGVDMGNPHLAAVIPGLDEEALLALPVEHTVTWDEEFFPAGVNVEVVTPLRDGHVHMRVHERGVGETRSCGTGTVAAAVAALADAGRGTGVVTVHVPGGTVEVTVDDESSTLTGPSRLVAQGRYHSCSGR